MAKLVFPNVSDKAYKDFVSKVRTELNKWKQKIERSPSAASDLRRQLNSLGVSLGSFFVDGTVIVVRNSIATKSSNGLADVNEATGVLTDVDLPAVDTIVNNGMTLTGVTPTGTFVTTVTFTVAGGVITAIALS